MVKQDNLHGVPSFFVALLQALQLQGAELDGVRDMTDASRQELLAFCDLAHLTLPLMRLCEEAAPEWMATRAKRNLADNQSRVARITAAYFEISTAFASFQVEHLVLKGFTQAPEFARNLDERMQSDVDLYCPEEFISAARAALNSLGYEENATLGKYPADHVPEMTRRRGWEWRGNAYDPEMPPAVDLHFCFWNHAATCLFVPGVNDFWGRRIERCSHRVTFPALSPVDHLGFHALHILRDVLRGDWVLHHVYELAFFLHTHADDQEFWAAWKAAHDDSFRSLQAVSFWLAREWFHCRWADALNVEAARMPRPVQEWLKRFASSPLTGMFHPNKHGVWLHVALLASPWDRLRVLGGTLLPLRLPVVGAPGQDATKTRRTRKFWPSRRYARYIFHIAFRAAFHLQTLTDTLWHGFSWWLNYRVLSGLRGSPSGNQCSS